MTTQNPTQVELEDRMNEYFRPGWGSWLLSTRDLASIVDEIVNRQCAAELRFIAEDGTGWAIADHLRARADELDGSHRQAGRTGS